jgi:hypothetical protein
MKIEDVAHFLDEVQGLLDEIGASNINNAVTKISAERKNHKKELQKKTEQLDKLVDAIGVDNWFNAIRKVSSLLDKETRQLPKWIQVVPPSWCGEVNHKEYKKWLRFCQEQFLSVLDEMEEEQKHEQDFDLEEQINSAKELFATSLPWEFIDECSEFYHVREESEENLKLSPTAS